MDFQLRSRTWGRLPKWTLCIVSDAMTASDPGEYPTISRFRTAKGMAYQETASRQVEEVTEFQPESGRI